MASIRCVRPGLHHVGPLRRLAVQCGREVIERGDQIVREARGGGEVDRRREDVVRRLRSIDVVIGVYGRRRARAAASVASTSLTFMFDDVPEPVWNTSIGNWSSCSPRATSAAAASIAAATSVGITPSSALTAAAAALIRASAAMCARFEAGAGDREVLHRSLRLGPPERSRRHSYVAHRVVLDPILHTAIVPQPTSDQPVISPTTTRTGRRTP